MLKKIIAPLHAMLQVRRARFAAQIAASGDGQIKERPEKKIFRRDFFCPCAATDRARNTWKVPFG
jgi:hypothetical protein